MSVEIPDTVIEGCKKNDPKMQQQLYTLSYSYLMNICYRYTSDISQANALLNDALVKVFQKINSFEGKGNVMAWIRRIVVNTCIDFFRSNSKDVLYGSKEMEDVKEDISFDYDALKQLESQDLLQLIQNLPKEMSLIFRLYAIEGYSHKEIAEKLNINISTSKWYTFEARKKLKQQITTMYS